MKSINYKQLIKNSLVIGLSVTTILLLLSNFNIEGTIKRIGIFTLIYLFIALLVELIYKRIFKPPQKNPKQLKINKQNLNNHGKYKKS